jgi:mono/diheme cytochrome c family protein
MKHLNLLYALIIMCLLGIAVIAQDAEVSPECTPENLTTQYETFSQFLTPDFESDPEQALANLFRLSAAYQDMAIRCGYIPNEPEVDVMLTHVLEFASLDDLIAAQSIGTDVEAILLELEEVDGDPITGQLLYNGLEPVLGGAFVGCSGCHADGQIAPSTEGTWTRITDHRLLEPQFEDYTVQHYLVESIVHPEAFVAEPYQNVMPNMYGTQLTIQQLADIVAFLDSQDQLLEEE